MAGADPSTRGRLRAEGQDRWRDGATRSIGRLRVRGRVGDDRLQLQTCATAAVSLRLMLLLSERRPNAIWFGPRCGVRGRFPGRVVHRPGRGRAVVDLRGGRGRADRVEMAGQISGWRTGRCVRTSAESTPARRGHPVGRGPGGVGAFGEKLSTVARNQLTRIGVDVQLGVNVVGVDNTGVDVIEPDGTARRVSAPARSPPTASGAREGLRAWTGPVAHPRPRCGRVCWPTRAPALGREHALSGREQVCAQGPRGLEVLYGPAVR
jgi:hypothetical protein